MIVIHRIICVTRIRRYIKSFFSDLWMQRCSMAKRLPGIEWYRTPWFPRVWRRFNGESKSYAQDQGWFCKREAPTGRLEDGYIHESEWLVAAATPVRRDPPPISLQYLSCFSPVLPIVFHREPFVFLESHSTLVNPVTWLFVIPHAPENARVA